MKSATLAVLAALLPLAAQAEGKTHHIAVHVDQNDPAVMNMALNNVQNLTAYYASQGDTTDVELVAYGPGLTMLLKDSPVAGRIAEMSLASEALHFDACGNTLKGMEAKAGHKLALLDEARVVPSGVVKLIELQEAGYSYVRP